MKNCFAILSLFACLACMGAEKPKPVVSKQDLKAADKDFKSALELQKKGKIDEALLAATKAAELVPGNLEYITTAELLRQQIVQSHLEQGNRLAADGDSSGASQHFRSALDLDPQNSYVAQRLHDVAPPDSDPEHAHLVQLLASVDEINLQPAAGKKSFHLQGDTRQLYIQIGTAFGITMRFDQNMNNRSLRFDLDNVDFYTAMDLAGKMTKTFWSPISSYEAMVATDSLEMRKQYERMAMRTLYIGNIAAPTDLNDLVNVLRTIFDMKLVNIQPSRNLITIRAPREQVEAAASLLENLMDAKPELVLDIKEFEINTDNLRDMGINLPTGFQVFNIPSEIRRVLGTDAQPVIDQLNATGTIDPSKIPPSALSNLAGSPLLAPFLFFGKGLSLTGFTVPNISAKLALNRSTATNLEHATLRAIDGEAATFRVGTRFPIVNSTFTSVAFSSQGQTQIGNTPQFTYVDLGLTFKATPHYHTNGDVTLLLDLQIQGLGALQINSIPDISSRSYSGTITVQDGEPSVIMGSISEQEIRSTQGLPLLSELPGLRSLLSTNSKDRTHSELLMVVTPHVVRKPFHDNGSGVFWTLNP
ncbi:MAG: type II and III secretion system protein [Candidatus Angelobacter sp.]